MTSNIQRINKSILERYFKDGSYPRGHDILSLKKISPNKETNGINYETIDVEVKIDGVTFKEHVVIIRDIRCSNMMRWFDRFETLAKESKWSPEKVKEFLRKFLKYPEVTDAMIKDGFDEVKSKVLRLLYGVESLKILNGLYRVKQYYFVGIKEYEQKITDGLTIYSSCVNCSKDEFRRHVMEIYFNGIGRHTKEALIKLNLMNDIDGAKKYLFNIEKIVCLEGTGLIDQNDISRMLSSMNIGNNFNKNGSNFNNNMNNFNNNGSNFNNNMRRVLGHSQPASAG